MMMRKEWIFLLGSVVLLVHLAPRLALAGSCTDPVSGHDPSSQEKSPDATVMPADTGCSKSEATVPRIRRRRSSATEITPVDDPAATAAGLFSAPLNILRSLGAAPGYIVAKMVDWGREKIWSLSATMILQVWMVTKNFIVPNLDKTLMRIAKVDTVPQNIKDMINSAHSTYAFMKLFGYMKPEA